MAAPEALELVDRVPQLVPEQPAPERLQVTEIVGGVTVRVVDPLTPPEVAWIIEVPTPFAVANPEALIKSAGFEELQVTKFVTLCVEPSL
jgi:hypothetical protein